MSKSVRDAAMRPQARKENLIVKEVDNEILIYDLERYKATCINEFAADVWDLCDGKRTPSEIKTQLSLTDEKSSSAVDVALDKLNRARLLEPDFVLAERDLSNQNRRDLLRGLAVGAIPVVTAIAIPTAAQAATCNNYLDACQNSPDCCSINCTAAPSFPNTNPSNTCTHQKCCNLN